ncbi:MAG: BTAD domain-containing putative transcriptional regulator [Candidatus Sericytochromatia bacterium]|nr:BTAD domain-containing putative transcriptional regulator [Candidatus Sericytochromatia bacterium]
MPEAWILSSKLAVPTLPRDALSRDFFPSASKIPPWVFLVAGPGYGKTLGLLSLVMPRQAAGVPIVWFSLDPHDADVSTFFLYLVAGVRAHVPQFGGELNALLTAERFEPRLLWQRFFQTLAAFNLPEFLLVLDDVHHLQSGCPEVLRALSYFFDKLPPGFQMLLSSRERVQLPMGRAQAYGYVRVLTEEILRFSSEEEVEFMRRRARGRPIPNAWWKKATGLDGWPLGLDLATAVEESRELTLDPRTAGVEPLTEYVAEELYGAQPEALRDFMRQIAILSDCTPDVCRDIFQVDSSADWLASLEAAHLVRRLADGASYRFPTYLRDFLLAEGARVDAREKRVAWHQQAAHYFALQPERAFSHWVAAHSWTPAVAACERVFPLMRFSGRQAQIQRWLNDFPAPVAAQEPVLQVWQGHLLSRAGQQVQATTFYERASHLFALKNDRAGLFQVRVRQATIALLHEGLRDSLTATFLALDADDTARDEDRADLSLARGLYCEQRGELAEMARHNGAVLKIPVGGNIEVAASHCIAQLNLYTISLHWGELEAADRHIIAAVELAHTWSFGPYLLFARFMQAHLWLLRGEIEPATQFFRSLPTHWMDEMDWHDVACAYATLGFWYQLRGNFKEAESVLARSHDTFVRAENPEGRKVALERQLWLWLVRRQLGKIRKHTAEIVECPGALIYDLVLLPPLARALHLEGDIDGAVALWKRAVEGFRVQRATLHLARTLLYQAATCRAAGREKEALAAVQDALGLVEQHGYSFLLGADQSLWEELASVVPSFSDTIELLGTPRANRVGRETQEPPRALSVSGAGASPPFDPMTPQGALTLRCFGTLEVRLDGVLIDYWPRRKAKLVLAGLSLYSRGLLLSQMLDLLGGDEMTPAAMTTLKVDISALRRVLEPNLSKGQGSRYVLTHDDRYLLDWNAVAYLDVGAFDEAIRKGDALREMDSLQAVAAYEEALSHYRGTLLDDGLFSHFFEAEREQYRQQALSALLWLAAHFKGLGAFTLAEQHLQRAMAVAPTSEEVYVALMHLQIEMGRTERVRQVYWDCRRAMKANLGLPPSDTFEAAYQNAIRRA